MIGEQQIFSFISGVSEEGCKGKYFRTQTGRKGEESVMRWMGKPSVNPPAGGCCVL